MPLHNLYKCTSRNEHTVQPQAQSDDGRHTGPSCCGWGGGVNVGAVGGVKVGILLFSPILKPPQSVYLLKFDTVILSNDCASFSNFGKAALSVSIGVAVSLAICCINILN